jgi:hypothetical protein
LSPALLLATMSSCGCSGTRCCNRPVLVFTCETASGRAVFPIPAEVSPRAYWAWPLAWPSPSGPLGWQRLQCSRVGPEDRFCEAVRNDLRVPLTLEGPARTMRGVPALVIVTSSRLPAHLARGPTTGLLLAGATQRELRRGPQAAGRRGAVSGSRRARRAAARKGASEAAAPATVLPRVDLSRLRRVTLAASLSPGCPRSPLAAHSHAEGPARRRCALEAVEKVVTAHEG